MPSAVNSATGPGAPASGGWAHHDSTYGGGIWWRRSVRDQKNVATNGPAAMTALKLYVATGDASYLNRAQSLFAWIKSTLQAGGRVYDRLEGSGTLVRTDYTYNPGNYIGAAAALYRATGDGTYLADAVGAADWAVTNLECGGTLLDEGIGDAGGFRPILVRHLHRLVTQLGQTQYLSFLQRNANQAWNHRRPGDGLIGPNWSAPTPETPLQSLTAGAGVALLQIVPPEDMGIQADTGVHQAENASPVGIEMETEHPGFTGRGYLAGWSGSGQSLTFHLNVTTSGPHTLSFRYAAGAGPATRRILVNGKAATDHTFAPTPDWSTWSDSTLEGVNLEPGHNSLRIEIDTASGNGNYLNLDHIEVAASPSASSEPLT